MTVVYFLTVMGCLYGIVVELSGQGLGKLWLIILILCLGSSVYLATIQAEPIKNAQLQTDDAQLRLSEGQNILTITATGDIVISDWAKVNDKEAAKAFIAAVEETLKTRLVACEKGKK